MRAWAIDVGVALGIGGAALGAGMGVAELTNRRPALDRLIDSLGRRFHPLEEPFGALRPRMKRPYRLAMLAATAGAAVMSRNSRGLGSRNLGLRKVETRTGNPVSVRAALVHWGASLAWKELVDLPFEPLTKRAERRLHEVHAEVEAVKRRHPDDAEARNKELFVAYRDSGVNPFGSCGLMLAKIVLRQMPILITPKHQSVPDLVAGLVVVQQ